jgi:hypothetical protein
MFQLDYISCFLTVVATILVGKKMWTGLVVSGINSLIVCVIGLHTSQYGFIPANVFCICINAYNLRTWFKVQQDPSESTTDASSELVAGCKRLSPSKNAAPRRLINSFRMRSEGRLGNSISSLAVKGVWPFAPTSVRTNTPSHQHKLRGAHPWGSFIAARVGVHKSQRSFPDFPAIRVIPHRPPLTRNPNAMVRAFHTCRDQAVEGWGMRRS